MQNRPEVDGLRAVAVLPVLLFHARVPGFANGFVGVDVFFVISGFLIARWIDEHQAANRFSLTAFYERRARRILPALLLVMLACLPMAWFVFLPDDLESFGQSLVATTLMSNNLLLWWTSGYWDLPAAFKPLVHTWSLAVEEQFYLLFPFLAIACAPLRPAVRVGLASALLALSLAGAFLLRPVDPQASFLMLPTRAWQILAGVVCAWCADPVPTRRGDVLAVVGALLLCTAFAVPLEAHAAPFPGVASVCACTGSTLLLRYARDGGGVGRWLAMPALAGIGVISYGLYLWHQPLLAFLRSASLQAPPLWHSLLALGLAGVLAFLSWRYVETPCRDARRVPRRPFVIAVCCAALVCIVSGALLHFNFRPGASMPIKDDVEGVRRWALAEYNERPLQFEGRPFLPGAGQRVLVVGNSFARDFINAGLENGYFRGSQLSYARGGLACISAGPPDRTDLLRLIAQTDVLVLGHDSLSEACWPADARYLQTLLPGRLVVLGVKDFGWNLNAAARLAPAQRASHRAAPTREIVQANRADRVLVGDAWFVDQLGLLMDGQGRVPVFTPEGRMITGDRRHFTPAGARYVGQILFAHPLLADLR